MKRNLDRILLIVLLSFVAGGIGYAIKIYIDFLGGGDSELVDAISDTGGITESIVGISDNIAASRRRADYIANRSERIEAGLDRLAEHRKKLKERIKRLETGCDKIEAGLSIGREAKRKLDNIIRRLQSEDIEGSEKN